MRGGRRNRFFSPFAANCARRTKPEKCSRPAEFYENGLDQRAKIQGPRSSLPGTPKSLREGGRTGRKNSSAIMPESHEASFLFTSANADSSSSTRSRTTRSTHLSTPASRCSFARKDARAASSPGIDNEAGRDRLTRIGASHAESSFAWEITSLSIASGSGDAAFFFRVFIMANPL